MSSEKISNSSKEGQEKFSMEFCKEYPRDGIVKYVFKNVEVLFNTEGKTPHNLPEIGFGTFDNEPTADSFNQPGKKREGVSMKYIAECVKIALKDSGYREVWFNPYGEDARESAKKSDLHEIEIEHERSQARLRLFSQYAAIEPDDIGSGYIIKI